VGPAVVENDIVDVDVVDVDIGQETVVGVAVGGVRVGSHGHGCSVDPAREEAFGFLSTLFVGVAITTDFGGVNAEKPDAFIAAVDVGSDRVTVDDVINGDCGNG